MRPIVSGLPVSLARAWPIFSTRRQRRRPERATAAGAGAASPHLLEKLIEALPEGQLDVRRGVRLQGKMLRVERKTAWAFEVAQRLRLAEAGKLRGLQEGGCLIAAPDEPGHLKR